MASIAWLPLMFTEEPLGLMFSQHSCDLMNVVMNFVINVVTPGTLSSGQRSPLRPTAGSEMSSKSQRLGLGTLRTRLVLYSTVAKLVPELQEKFPFTLPSPFLRSPSE